MNAVYGTQKRYSDEVISSGMLRESSAFFLLPRVPANNIKFKYTLECAAFHAIGVHVLKEAAETGTTVLQTLLRRGEESICFLVFHSPHNLFCKHYSYRIIAHDAQCETYPYVKYRECGSFPVSVELVIPVAPEILNRNISLLDSDGYRFFQKKDGAPQYLPNTNMKVIQEICADIANFIIQGGFIS